MCHCHCHCHLLQIDRLASAHADTHRHTHTHTTHTGRMVSRMMRMFYGSQQRSKSTLTLWFLHNVRLPIEDKDVVKETWNIFSNSTRKVVTIPLGGFSRMVAFEIENCYGQLSGLEAHNFNGVLSYCSIVVDSVQRRQSKIKGVCRKAHHRNLWQ